MATIDLQQITLEDALNDPDPLNFTPPRPPLTARITCRVCDRREDVPISSSGLLCALCRADLDATEQHIRETLTATEQTLGDAWARWDADLAHADEADRERYQKVSAAQKENAPGFAERYRRALGKGDGLSVLLSSAERAQGAVRAMEYTQGWADAALGEVEAAR